MRAHPRLLAALAFLILPTGCAEEGPLCPTGMVRDDTTGECIVPDFDAGPMDAGDDTDGGDRDGGGCTEACTGATPVCVAGECVQCETVDDCTGGETYCEDNRCVFCRSHADCTDPDAARCDETTGACEGCTLDEHCMMGVADAEICDAETCVECLPERPEACNGGDNVCDPATLSCTDRPAEMTGLCQPCVASAECMPGMRCVLQSYGTPTPVPVGSFCLWEEAAPAPGPAGNCFNAEPYTSDRTGMTVEGDTVTVCDLLLATCPALEDHRRTTCGASSVCGAGVDDGFCHSDGRCTYRCNDDSDCPGTFLCVTDMAEMVCDV